MVRMPVDLRKGWRSTAVFLKKKGRGLKPIMRLSLQLLISDEFADNKTGCRFITVDAYAAAIPFYLKNGFVPLNDDDIDDPTRLLFFDLNDLDED